MQMENACREFIFISEFFMVQGQNALDLFQQVLGKTLALISVRIIFQITVLSKKKHITIFLEKR